MLLLDEPTNHLDLRHQLQLARLIAGLDVTTIVVLHDARTGKGAMIDEGLRGRIGVGAG